MDLKWSDTVERPPRLLEPEAVGELRDRAYPYATTVIVKNTGDPPPAIVVTAESVTFRGQRGPVREVGRNGCQIDDLITFALGTIGAFNEKFPCPENAAAIASLEEALEHLEARRLEREARGVEGKDLE